eukprot:scaffold77940_cov67-Phaeocystis_antarctica.AAC.2
MCAGGSGGPARGAGRRSRGRSTLDLPRVPVTRACPGVNGVDAAAVWLVARSCPTCLMLTLTRTLSVQSSVPLHGPRPGKTPRRPPRSKMPQARWRARGHATL